MKRVHIIGAGFSGLTLGWYLSKKGCQITFYEKRPRSGGLISTEIREEMLIESAANALMDTELSQQLLRDLGIEGVKPKESAKKRYIWRHRPRQWPLNVGESFYGLLRFLLAFRFQKKNLKPKPMETLHSWGERIFGKKMIEFLITPVFQGIYGCEVQNLSATLLLQRFFIPNRPKYRGLITSKKGLGDVISKLEEHLKNKGAVFKYETEGVFTDKDIFVLATPPAEAAKILKPHRPEISACLSEITSSSLISVAVSIPVVENKIEGFGMLVPSVFKFNVMGILSNSYIFEDRGNTYNETWIMKQAENLSDSKIVDLIQNERRQLLGDSSKVHILKIHRWSPALPFYSVSLEQILVDLQRLLQKEKSLFLTGNYLGKIGLSQILENNVHLAESIANV